MQISMDGKGRAFDMPCTGRLPATCLPDMSSELERLVLYQQKEVRNKLSFGQYPSLGIGSTLQLKFNVLIYVFYLFENIQTGGNYHE